MRLLLQFDAIKTLTLTGIANIVHQIPTQKGN